MIRRLKAGTFVSEELAYEANDWLMRTMQHECRRSTVTAVHAYEDCSLWQFQESKRLGKACIYDMPIGYYAAWQQTQAALVKQYSEWVPSTGLLSLRYVRPEQKRTEMELADVVLAPSNFARRTIQQFVDKPVALAPYGVDLAYWAPDATTRGTSTKLKLIYAGQCSLRKGVPMLVDAWRAAGLRDAELELVGSWQLAPERLRDLPPGIRFVGPVSSEQLRARYNEADLLVFPSYFEGLSLALLEALATGLPAIATDATVGTDELDDTCGRLIPTDNLDAMVEALRWAAANRSILGGMRRAARAKAEAWTWTNYRRCVTEAVAPFA
jgi:glycosyltransferase involved in cell wall biosynthesis